MRKIIITVALASFALVSQAQLFVGGELGFNTTGGKFKPKDGDEAKTPRETMINLAPVVGFQMSEKLAVGARINFLSFKATEFKFNGTDDQITSFSGVGLDLFGQYTFVEFDKFSVYAEATLGFATGKSKRKLGSTTDDGDKSTGFGFNIRPVLAYALSEKIDLLCNLNFLSLGFSSVTEKDPDGNKAISSDFGLNVNANNVAAMGIDQNLGAEGLLTIGFRYKF